MATKRKNLGIRAILKAAKAKCAKCGSTEDLDVHHIIDLSRGGTNDPTNLVIVCKACHDAIHNTIPKRKRKLEQAET